VSTGAMKYCTAWSAPRAGKKPMLRHTLLSDGWKSWKLLNRSTLPESPGMQDDAELHSLSAPKPARSHRQPSKRAYADSPRHVRSVRQEPTFSLFQSSPSLYS
jgi:hypothetical protein